ncbi:MAG: 2-amino-4-hydroxy-6-hydroxymethyldihydropteridine diphosphokinase, partial [Gammaproteobacteria bacterium]|nr:2-amino-4-hydroxy-6-hydroxymethyldihydropteridine diphosphokinase [Gammaproteobacteria bacterium]
MNTVIIGLGSNLTSPLQNLRQAVSALRHHADIELASVSSVYCSDALLPENAASDWQKTYLNAAIKCTTRLQPDAVLRELKKIERNLGRTITERWAPRIIDLDILSYNELHYQTSKIIIPHKEVLNRPFALLPLLELLPNWQHPQQLPLPHWRKSRLLDIPFNTKKIPQRIDTPMLMGIINITPDSFSDGNQYNSVDAAKQQIKNLWQQGVHIIDIGAESTRPHANIISEQEEWYRLQPILQAANELFSQQTIKPEISVDTRHARVAQQALAFNINYINDVSAASEPAMLELIAEKNIHY